MDRNDRVYELGPSGLAWLTLLGLLLSVAPARADTSTVPAGLSQPSESALSAELTFIEHSFGQQRLGAGLWFSGWVGFNSANAAVAWWQYAVGENRVERDAWLMSALGSSFCVLSSAIFPLPGMYGAQRLRRWGADSSLSLQERHRRAFALLENAAELEASNSGVLAHVVGLGYALASSAYIYFRSMHAEPKALATAVSLQFVSTVVVVEATIWTVPRRARRDLAELRARRARTEPAKPVAPTSHAAPLRDLRLTLSGPQLGLRLSF